MSKERRFGSDHVPPPNYGLDTLKGVFQQKVIARLTRYAKIAVLDESNVLQMILESYPEKGIRQLASATGLTVSTMQDIFDFLGAHRLPFEQMTALNRTLKKGIYGLTDKERKEIASKAARKTVEEKIGVHNPKITSAQRQAAGRKGGSISGSRNVAQRIGVHKRTRQEHQQDGLLGSEVLGSEKVIFENNYFDSYVEAAAAAALETFIPKFTLERGRNYQVIIKSSSIKIDFMIDQVLVEYNPIILTYPHGRVQGAFTKEEFEIYRNNLNQLDKKQREEYTAQVKDSLLQRYFQRRRKALDQDSAYRNKELVVVTTPEELYDDIITRFGENYPDRNEFVRFFNSATRTIKKENKKRLVGQGQ